MSDKLWSHLQEQLNIDPMEEFSSHNIALARNEQVSGVHLLLPNHGSLKRKTHIGSMSIEQMQQEISSKEQLLLQTDLMQRLPDGGKRITEKIAALKQQMEQQQNSFQPPVPVNDFEEMSLKHGKTKIVEKEQRSFTQDPTILMATGKRTATDTSAKLVSLHESMKLEGLHNERRMDELKTRPKNVQELVQTDVMDARYRDFDDLMDEGPMDD
jgi:hypothetical protein